MTRVTHSSVYAVPADFAFDYISDYKKVPNLVFGLERFEPRGEQTRGLGAEFDALVDVGPMKLDPVIDVTEWIEGEYIGLHGTQKLVDVTIEVRTQSENSEPKAKVQIVADYTVGKGFTGMILEKALVIFAKLAIAFFDHRFRSLVEGSYAKR